MKNYAALLGGECARQRLLRESEKGEGMNAREVLDGLKAAEWRRTYRLPGRPKLCPVCGGMFGDDPEECGHDEGCALAAAIAYLEDIVGAEDIRAKAEPGIARTVAALDGNTSPLTATRGSFKLCPTCCKV